MHRHTALPLFATTFALLPATPTSAVILVGPGINNGGFETGAVDPDPFNSAPFDPLTFDGTTSFGQGRIGAENGGAGGVWSGDAASIATFDAEGVLGFFNPLDDPHSGTQMLRFVTTVEDALIGSSPFDISAVDGRESEVYQLIDVSAWAPEIAGGDTTIDASGWFMTNDVNTGFSLELRFYDGVIDDFVNDGAPLTGLWLDPGEAPFWSHEFDHSSVSFFAPYWEHHALSDINGGNAIPVPTTTDFVMLRIAARETTDTEVFPEFRGMFADDILLEMNLGAVAPDPIPEPTRPLLALIALASITLRRRR